MEYTESKLLDALERTYPNMAIMRQATIYDPEYMRKEAAWRKRQYADYYSKNPNLTIHRIDTTGVDPDDFDPQDVGYRRIDALMFGSITRNGDYQRTAVEAKISRADFKRETDEKREPWRIYTHRFVYLTPPGLLHPDEIPEGCGLWEVTPLNRVRSVKKCKLNKAPMQLPESFTRSLVFRLQKAEMGTRKPPTGVVAGG